MATLLSLVKDPYIKLANGSSVKPSSLSADALKAYILNHPTVLVDGWMVSNGSIVQKPAAPSIGVVPVNTPAPRPAPVAPVVAPVTSTAAPTTAPTTGSPAPTGGGGFDRTAIKDKYVEINGKAVAISTLSDATLKQYAINHPTILADGWTVSNGSIVRAPTTTTAAPTGGGGGSTGGGSGSGTGAGGGATTAPPTPAPPTTTTTSPTATSWIPRIGLGGINADPITGKIDWSSVIKQAQDVSAVDPTYAQDLSNNIFSAMQALQLPQSEVQSLTAIDPSTGKTLYQNLFDTAKAKYGSDKSNAFSAAAARGVASSGMTNTTQAGLYSANQAQNQTYDKQYGNGRLTDLFRNMADTLAGQDTNFAGSYYAALSRAQQAIPTIPNPTTTPTA